MSTPTAVSTLSPGLLLRCISSVALVPTSHPPQRVPRRVGASWSRVWSRVPRAEPRVLCPADGILVHASGYTRVGPLRESGEVRGSLRVQVGRRFRVGTRPVFLPHTSAPSVTPHPLRFEYRPGTCRLGACCSPATWRLDRARHWSSPTTLGACPSTVAAVLCLLPRHRTHHPAHTATALCRFTNLPSAWHGTVGAPLGFGLQCPDLCGAFDGLRTCFAARAPAPAAGLGCRLSFWARPYGFRVRSRRALLITLTEDKAMAAAATIGDSSHPKAG
jgi:hypothetical protein